MKRLIIHTVFKWGAVLLILFPAVQLYAQTINVDSLPLKELMYIPKLNTIQFPVRNISKDSLLMYQAYIEYKRAPGEIIIQDSLSMEKGNSSFNHLLQYVDSAYLSAAYGNSDFSQVTVATLFTADSIGFNLSNVGTWFISEEVTSGTIQVQIRAGGNSIQDAIIVSQGAAQFKMEENEVNGHFYNIKLEKEVPMYPNEDFYVVFTYPGGIARPQGCAVNEAVETVEGRYWVEINNQFVDLQQMEGYKNGAWLMYAAEDSSKNSGWLNFAGKASGNIRAQDSTLVRLQLNGTIANLGSQYADVVILSNDTVNPEIRVPVELRLNEAPYFLNAPTDISITEGDSTKISIEIKDMENDSISVAPVMGCKFVQFSVVDSLLNLTVSPLKSDTGNYVVRFAATDKYNMTRELTITIHVLPHQAPVFINPPAEISVEETYQLDFKVGAYDPGNEDFEIILTDSLGFANYSFSNDTITIHLSPQLGDAGDYTLHLKAQDTFGSVSELNILLHVLIKNRPPVYIGDDSPIVFSFMEGAKSFNISNYFMDPDGDAFTFEIFNPNPNTVEVSTDNKTWFIITPKSVGNTALDFTLTDARGEQASYSIAVNVGLCENPEGIIVQKWNRVLLVNNQKGLYASNGYQWYKNGLPVKNATRQDYSAEDDTGGLLDFTAEYFVRMIKITGDTVYTCPYKPVQKAITSKVYPNPVAKGMSINIENESSGSGIIQIIDVLGNIQKTIQTERNVLTVPAPDIPGLYLVKIVFPDSKNVFRIKVY
jgi:hypothetical protein